MNEYTEQLEERIKILEEIVLRRSSNQIQYPLDEMSKSVLGQSVGVPSQGTGSFGTQVVSVAGGGGGTVTVPAQPSGTVKVIINGTTVELLKK